MAGITLIQKLQKLFGARAVSDMMGRTTNVQTLAQGINNPFAQTFSRKYLAKNPDGVDEAAKVIMENMQFAFGNKNAKQMKNFEYNVNTLYDMKFPPAAPAKAEAQILDLSTKKQVTGKGIESLKNKMGLPEGVSPDSPMGKILIQQNKMNKVFSDEGTTLEGAAKKYSENQARQYSANIESYRRPIIRQMLLKDTRINLPDNVRKSLESKMDLSRGADPKMDPLRLLNEYYDVNFAKLDELEDIRFTARNETEAAEEFLKKGGLEPKKPMVRESLDDEAVEMAEQSDLGDKLKDLPDDIDPDALAQGGRAGFKVGGLSRLLKMLQGKVGKKNITTADKMDRPESALNREMFGAFENRMNRKILDVPPMPGGFQLSREKLLKNFPELDESYADEIMAMDKELQGRVLMMLKDRRKDPKAYDKLLMEKGDTLDFQGEFDRSVQRSKNADGGIAGQLHLNEGGRVKFGDGGIKISPNINITKIGSTPYTGIDQSVTDRNYGVSGLLQLDNKYIGGNISKGNVKVEVQKDGNTVFNETLPKEKATQIYAGLGERFGNNLEVGTDMEGNFTFKIKSSFNQGGRVGLQKGGPLLENDFYSQFYGMPYAGYEGQYFKTLQDDDPNYDEIRRSHTAGSFADLVNRGLVSKYSGPTDYQTYLSNYTPVTQSQTGDASIAEQIAAQDRAAAPATGEESILDKLNPSAETIVQRMQNVQNQPSANSSIRNTYDGILSNVDKVPLIGSRIANTLSLNTPTRFADYLSGRKEPITNLNEIAPTKSTQDVIIEGIVNNMRRQNYKFDKPYQSVVQSKGGGGEHTDPNYAVDYKGYKHGNPENYGITGMAKEVGQMFNTMTGSPENQIANILGNFTVDYDPAKGGKIRDKYDFAGKSGTENEIAKNLGYNVDVNLTPKMMETIKTRVMSDPRMDNSYAQNRQILGDPRMRAAYGGRIGLEKGGPPNPGRRSFMKLMAGLASIPVLGKFFKGAKVASKIPVLKNTTTTMPAWFPDLVDKFITKGIGNKIDQDMMEYTVKELPDVKLLKQDNGAIRVEGKNAYNEEYYIDYEPPGVEVVDFDTGKTVKTKGDFVATDTEYRMVSPEDYDIDGVNVDQIDDILGGSSNQLEGFAKGTGKTKYTTGQRRIDEADARGASTDESIRADVNDPYGDIDPTDFVDPEDYAKGGLAGQLL